MANVTLAQHLYQRSLGGHSLALPTQMWACLLHSKHRLTWQQDLLLTKPAAIPVKYALL